MYARCRARMLGGFYVIGDDREIVAGLVPGSTALLYPLPATSAYDAPALRSPSVAGPPTPLRWASLSRLAARLFLHRTALPLTPLVAERTGLAVGLSTPPPCAGPMKMVAACTSSGSQVPYPGASRRII